MHDKNRVVFQTGAVLLGLGVILAAGCAHYKASPIAQNAPDWVNRGSGAFKDNGAEVFYGVGSVTGIRNRPLQVAAADDRARAEIAKILDTYVAVLSKDYMASTTAGDMTKSDEEQYVSQTLKSFAKFTLTGATIVDHWKDPSDGTLFSLCKFDMAAMQKTLGDSKDLSASLRDYVQKNADKAFAELGVEETKH